MQRDLLGGGRRMKNFKGRVLLLQTKSLVGGLPPPPSARPCQSQFLFKSKNVVFVVFLFINTCGCDTKNLETSPLAEEYIFRDISKTSNFFFIHKFFLQIFFPHLSL